MHGGVSKAPVMTTNEKKPSYLHLCGDASAARLAESLVRGSVTTYLALLSLNILVRLLFNLNL